MEWIEYFARMLDVIKLKSKDPSTKVGALITDSDHAIISTGFNGFPSGVVDRPERYEDRELKYQMVVHAEMNAILLAAKNGKSLKGCTIWVNKYPCCECTKAIIQSGIEQVCIIETEPDEEFEKRWEKSIQLATIMFREAKVIVSKLYKGSDDRYWRKD